MTGLWIALAFIAWYSASLIVSEQFADKKPGKQWLFFISFVFSPFLALVFVYLLNRNQ